MGNHHDTAMEVATKVSRSPITDLLIKGVVGLGTTIISITSFLVWVTIQGTKDDLRDLKGDVRVIADVVYDVKVNLAVNSSRSEENARRLDRLEGWSRGVNRPKPDGPRN